jgi:hypothetical protein
MSKEAFLFTYFRKKGYGEGTDIPCGVFYEMVTKYGHVKNEEMPDVLYYLLQRKMKVRMDNSNYTTLHLEAVLTMVGRFGTTTNKQDE